MLRTLLLTFVSAVVLLGQKYTGPEPEKSDLPYLIHADALVPTEATEAKEENRKDEITYVIEGASSPVATPLASPAFLIRADQLVPDKLQLYKMEAKNGRRELLFSRKKKPIARPINCTVTRVGDNLFKLEVDGSLGNGEYSISPDGSNQVFCFRVY
jgi:hypothetical protein